MQEKLLDATKEAVTEIASTMLFMEVAPTNNGSGTCPVVSDFSAVVGYSGAVQGSVRLAGSIPAALKLASGLMGEDQGDLSDDAKDAFAELCNMVAGGVQTRVSPSVGQINLTPPVVVSGSNHHVSGKSGETVIYQIFDCEGMQFFVEIMYV
ncbi:MAG: chemotaxis protein CheX [Magnetococcales bacterium]|nr:chemotaxis protein CheX [Magnetococcales bacterium]